MRKITEEHAKLVIEMLLEVLKTGTNAEKLAAGKLLLELGGWI